MAQRINTIIEFEQKSIGKSGALFDVKKLDKILAGKKIRSVIR